MTTKKLRRKIRFKKNLLNKLLLLINPTNKFAVYLSESLDKDVSLYQKRLYKFYKRKHMSTLKKEKMLVA
ncbi:hypothetical protein [uncultured Clostridium sp.]|uniref:hypothetical protein n=1 Tax=uncultured Clostridium sp. TaxID=59620 RepID=UPI0026186E45|nr:hypothetical protein [uncultured Clostridium sp.]